MGETEMISVPRKRYEYLRDRNRRLSAMEAGGVDNWEGLHYALESAGLLDEEEIDPEDE